MSQALVRGEVWLATLDPVGAEINKARPCVVISPPETHDHVRTVMVAPMTTGSRPAPFRVAVRFLGRDDLIVLDHVRTLDKARRVRRLSAIDPRVLARTLSALREMFED